MGCHVLRCAGVLLAGALSVAGCSREQSSAATDEQMPTLPSSSETSLSLKRGLIKVEGQLRTFKPCDGTEDLWVIDQSDGSFQTVVTIAEADEAIYAETRGEPSPIPDNEPMASRFSGAYVMEQVVYAGAPAPGRGCEAPEPNYIVRARGNEAPVWAVEVTEAKMEWLQDKGEAITIDLPKEDDTEGAVSYEGRNDQHTLQVIIESQTCRDPTTEEFFAYSARAVLDGKEFRGCARVGR